MYLENISIELCGYLLGTFSVLVCWKPVFVEYFEVERETKSKLAALIVKRNSMRPQMSGIENSEGCVRVVGEGGGGAFLAVHAVALQSKVSLNLSHVTSRPSRRCIAHDLHNCALKTKTRQSFFTRISPAKHSSS